jgi:hypothetical protein
VPFTTARPSKIWPLICPAMSAASAAAVTVTDCAGPPEKATVYVPVAGNVVAPPARVAAPAVIEKSWSPPALNATRRFGVERVR